VHLEARRMTKITPESEEVYKGTKGWHGCIGADRLIGVDLA